jgi:hypothetical protein
VTQEAFCLRAAAALDAPSDDARPNRAWPSVHGSVLAAATARVLALLAPAGRLLDASRRVLENTPWSVAAATLAAAPILQLLLPGSMGTRAASAAALLAGFLVLARVCAALHLPGERAFAGGALLLGLLFRIGAAAVVESRGGFPDERGYYHPVAAETAASWALGGPTLFLELPLTAAREVYYGLLSGTYLLLGADPVSGRAVGILLGLLAALLAGELARPLGGARAAAVAVALLALHPEHALWSATLSRDTLTTVLVLAALVFLVRRREGRSWAGWLGAATCTALLARNSFLAAGAMGAVLLTVATAEGVMAVRRRGVRGLPLLLAVLAIAAGGLVLLGRAYGPWFEPGMLSAVRNRGLDPSMMTERGLAWTTFLPGVVFRGPMDVLAYLPAGALFVLAAPFPWEWSSVMRAGYGLLAAVGLLIAACGVVGLAAGLRRRPGVTLTLLLFTVTFLGLLAVLEASSGIVVRHRLPLTAVLVVAAAPLFARRAGA